MDEWNRYPTNEPEQPTEPAEGQEQQTPTPPVPPTPPVQPSYSSYGWQQTPMYTPLPKKKKTAGIAVLISVICVAVIVVLAVLLVMVYRGVDLPQLGGAPITNNNDQVQQGNKPTLNITELEETVDGLTAREIISRNLDSTVLLKIYTKTTLGNGYPFGQNGMSQEVQSGSASGIIMTEDGYIITNWHCVINEDTNEPFPRVDVVLYDGTVFENATVVGADSSTDLAVIKVNATGLKPAEFGDSTTMQLGDRVVALGNAGGLGFSATQGILSGLARDVYEDTGYAIKCFQVDAAINPGNSGGPLFNAVGQVIAVNSAKIVAEGYEGLGFAIPINEAKSIIDDLIAYGYVKGRVSLGITGQTYSDAYYEGFLIYSINEDSPLRKTDVRKGDLITAVNGEKVKDYATLRAALAKNKVGDKVKLTLLRSANRNVQSFDVEVVLTEATQ